MIILTEVSMLPQDSIMYKNFHRNFDPERKFYRLKMLIRNQILIIWKFLIWQKFRQWKNILSEIKIMEILDHNRNFERFQHEIFNIEFSMVIDISVQNISLRILVHLFISLFLSFRNILSVFPKFDTQHRILHEEMILC